ncbi:hypothetical protein [Streptomyces meridianus]|uniref:Uncharacterized protein n=1 Tax=Streptomyces meridianus TaxID=2938945 RepID=A0ABT0XBH3_9ACTN|nr:hypothetical protein [Streptomyces meridianus]MCM2579846.1 hypothetical protein [Streptomyces meridianus]
MMNDMRDDGSAQTWDLVWRNTFLLVLFLCGSMAVAGTTGGLLAFFTDSPGLSVAGRVGGIVGGAVAVGAGILAVRANRIRSWRRLFSALGILAAAGLVMFGSRAL